jgi:hypothetical protein
MSVHISGLIWKVGPQERNQRFILLAIADAADENGYCWPSIKTLARQTLFSERYVIDAVAQLETDGWMRVARRAVHGRYTAYTVDLEKLEALRDEQRAEDKRRRSGAKSSPEITPKGDGSGAQSSPETSTSPEQSSPDRSISGEIRNTSEVNFDALSGEIRSTPILKNHHEPSLKGEPHKISPRTDDSFPEGLSELNYAAAIMERRFLAGGFRMKSLIGETVKLLAKMDNLELHCAAELLEKRITAAQHDNDTINSFWFEDQKWKADGGPRHGTNQGHRNTAAARTERALSAWDRARADRDRARAVR